MIILQKFNFSVYIKIKQACADSSEHCTVVEEVSSQSTGFLRVPIFVHLFLISGVLLTVVKMRV